MSIQGIFYVALHVSDLPRSKLFYSGKLQWKLETDEPTVAGLRFGDGYVVLLADSSSATAVQPGGMHVAVKVEGIAAEYARLKDLGVPVGELLSQPWGERSFSFKDPDGYEWSYGEASGGG